MMSIAQGGPDSGVADHRDTEKPPGVMLLKVPVSPHTVKSLWLVSGVDVAV